MEEKARNSQEKEVSKDNNLQKLTYGELNRACGELSQQNQNMQAYIKKLKEQMYMMDMSNQFKRMDYLFKVLELEAVIKDSDFVNSCIAEIKDMMTIPEETKEN